MTAKRKMACDDGFTAIWVTAVVLYAAHSTCGELGQWHLNRGKLECLVCGMRHPRGDEFPYVDTIQLNALESSLQAWVGWFLDVLPRDVRVIVGY